MAIWNAHLLKLLIFDLVSSASSNWSAIFSSSISLPISLSLSFVDKGRAAAFSISFSPSPFFEFYCLFIIFSYWIIFEMTSMISSWFAKEYRFLSDVYSDNEFNFKTPGYIFSSSIIWMAFVSFCTRSSHCFFCCELDFFSFLILKISEMTRFYRHICWFSFCFISP